MTNYSLSLICSSVLIGNLSTLYDVLMAVLNRTDEARRTKESKWRNQPGATPLNVVIR